MAPPSSYIVYRHDEHLVQLRRVDSEDVDLSAIVTWDVPGVAAHLEGEHRTRHATRLALRADQSMLRVVEDEVDAAIRGEKRHVHAPTRTDESGCDLELGP
jgi:hypothetical protein